MHNEKSIALSLDYILNYEHTIDSEEYANGKAASDYTQLSSENQMFGLATHSCPSPTTKDKYYDDTIKYDSDFKPKRKRANSFQTKILEEVFKLNYFPSTSDRLMLAKKVKMTPRAIQIWFQNKRQALKICRSNLGYNHNAYLNFFKL